MVNKNVLSCLLKDGKEVNAWDNVGENVLLSEMSVAISSLFNSCQSDAVLRQSTGWLKNTSNENLT